MSKLIISDHEEEGVEKEKILFFKIDRHIKNAYISVKHPRREEQLIHLAKYNLVAQKIGLTNQYSYSYKPDNKTVDAVEKFRKEQIIKVVNQLIEEGFTTRDDQLALFLNRKIDVLIMNGK